jgi:MoxR-like ATPase
MLAEEIAASLGRQLIVWPIKSTTKAQHGLYEYDAVSRLRDSQLGDAKVRDISNYIIKGQLWQAFEADTAPVLLIDEIDKADIEFPNDLLRELDQMEFFVHDTAVRACPTAAHHHHYLQQREGTAGRFLRRCFFHYIRFPDRPPCRPSWTCTTPACSSSWSARHWKSFLPFANCPG